MLLAIDIGNTNISCAIFKKNKIVKNFDIQSQGYNLAGLKKNLTGLRPQRSVLCSVVPVLTKALARDLRKAFGISPCIIGKDIKVPIKNRYRKPKQVGQDRLVNAYAASFYYGAPVIVVDCGTAITFDVVSAKGEYLGGLIFPGLRLSLDALFEKTALLPNIDLAKPRGIIGTDTRNSMLSGVIYGTGSLIDDLVLRIKKAIGKRVFVVGTGGSIGLISGYCHHLDKIDNSLTMKGLKLIYETEKSLQC